MKILLSYSKQHFDPAKQPDEHAHWGSSASILARTLYEQLSRMGEVTYVDKDEYGQVSGQKFDLFVGIAANFGRILDACEIGKSLFFAVNMHPAERNRLLTSFAKREGLPAGAFADWDLVNADAEAAALRRADWILCVGNTAVYNSYLRHGIPEGKVFMLNYGLPEAEWQRIDGRPDRRKGTDKRRYAYVASDIGLRKGFDIVAALFRHPDILRQDFHLDIVGPVSQPFYKEKMDALVREAGGKVAWHGWLDSHKDAYREILEGADFILFPSLEEGQAGTVIDAVAHGAIPLLTAETGIDFSPLGQFVAKSRSDANLELLERSLAVSPDELKDLRKRTVAYYREFHAGWEARLATAIQRCLEHGTPYPKVSLVLSVFNKETTIIPLVELLHAAAKRYGNAEFQIIIDGCKDRTEPLLREFFAARPDVPVHFEVTPNIFEVKSNNLGLRNARGDYGVIIQDDNFVYDDNFIFDAVSFLEKNPRAAVLGGLAGVNFYPRGTTGLEGSSEIKMTDLEVYWRQDAETDPILKQRVYEVDACMRGPLFLRKSFLEEHGYLDEVFAPLHQDDMDFCFRVHSLGYKVYTMLMNVSNDCGTVGTYDATRLSYFSQIMKRNIDLFYTRWQPSTDKSGYGWIHRTPLERTQRRRLPSLSALQMRVNRSLQPLRRIAKLLGKVGLIFNTVACERISLTLRKRPLNWMQDQKALLSADARLLEIGPVELASGHLPAGSYDAVLCSGGLEYAEDPVGMLKEISQALKPGGKLILTSAPISPIAAGEESFRRFCSAYGRAWYAGAFPRSGLRLDVLQPNGGLFGHAIDLLWQARTPIMQALRQGSPLHRLIAAILQPLVFNLPTAVLIEFERWRLLEAFSVGFFATAVKDKDSEPA